MNHKEIEINGQNIAYYESNGKGRPVLFVHGNSMSSLCFEKQLSSILGKTYRLVALDLPGHGRSAPAQEAKSGYALPGYAAVVSEFAKRLGIDGALLVGWCLGGHVILEASGQLPESAGLMLCGTPPCGKPMAPDAFMPNPLLPLVFTRDLNDEEISALTAEFFLPGYRIPPFFIDDMKRTDGRAREALLQSVQEGHYTDEVEVVANLNNPLAIIHGEMDSMANSSYIKNLSIPTLWRGDLQMIPDSGHTPHWEQPEIFNSLLDDFIQDSSHGLDRPLLP